MGSSHGDPADALLGHEGSSAWKAAVPQLVRYQPRGPHYVGVTDLAWLHPDRELHPLKHLAARLYYPTAVGPARATPWSLFRRWPASWLPGPMWARGFAEALVPPSTRPLTLGSRVKDVLLRLSLMLLVLVLGYTAALPAVYGAPLLPGPQNAAPQPSGDAVGDDEHHRHAGSVPQSATSTARLPVVLVSHGYLGNRTLYSSLCCELASQGYLVLAVEHADGTSSTTHLAPGIRARQETLPAHMVGGRWMFCSHCSPTEEQAHRTSWRVQELLTAHALLSALDQGLHVEGLTISRIPTSKPGLPFSSGTAAADEWASGIYHAQVRACLSRPTTTTTTPFPPTSSNSKSSGNSTSTSTTTSRAVTAASWLAGRLDLSRVAVVGHSWGGATTAVAVSEHPQFCAGVALDPSWRLVPKGSLLLCGKWRTSSPLLVIGSHDWNSVPDAHGELQCHLPNRSAALSASAQGGGSLLLVPKGTSHFSFDDILLFFQDLVQPVLKAFGFRSGMHPRRAVDLVHRATLHFLKTHLLAAPSSAPGDPVGPPLAEEAKASGNSTPVVAVPFAAHHLDAYLELFGRDLLQVPADLTLPAC